MSQRRDTMVSYLGDLMEDATDFTWQGTKAAHAVLMCEMERGSLQWEDTDRIDRIRRAHAQKHGSVTTFNLETAPTLGTICAFCLMGGKQLGHAEKECIFKKQNPQNDQAAAHH